MLESLTGDEGSFLREKYSSLGLPDHEAEKRLYQLDTRLKLPQETTLI